MREQEINKKWNKKKVRYWNKQYVRKVKWDLTTLITKCKFFEKAYEYDSIEKERELRVLAKEKINKNIKRRRWK